MSDDQLKTFAVQIRNSIDWRDSYELRFRAEDSQAAERLAYDAIEHDLSSFVGDIEQIDP